MDFTWNLKLIGQRQASGFAATLGRLSQAAKGGGAMMSKLSGIFATGAQAMSGNVAKLMREASGEQVGLLKEMVSLAKIAIEQRKAALQQSKKDFQESRDAAPIPADPAMQAVG